MAFSWSNLYNKMLDDLDKGNWRTASYTTPIGSRNFHSLKEFTDFLEYVEFRANKETGAVAGRTYAKQGGGGRW